MHIWIDALTPKQARLAAHLYEHFTRKGFKVLVTVREYDLTRYILDNLGVEYVSVGRHGGESLKSKLVADGERILALTKVVEGFNPDVLVAYPSPSALRVAFGLGIKSIVFSDSPHSIPAHLLTVPLADYLVYSSLIPRHFFEKYTSFKTRLVSYFGVEEVGWVRGHVCNENVLNELGLEKNSYVIIRLAERYAEYYRGRPKPNLLRLAEKLVREDVQVVLIPRYQEDYTLLRQLYEGQSGKIVVIWQRAVESLDLYCWSRLVITGGATMAREAALMCKQSLSLYPVYVNIVLEGLGFPILNYEKGYDFESLSALVDGMLEKPMGCSTAAKEMLNAFETPAETMLKLLEEMTASV